MSNQSVLKQQVDGLKWRLKICKMQKLSEFWIENGVLKENC
jgi:hypothetical protein